MAEPLTSAGLVAGIIGMSLAWGMVAARSHRPNRLVRKCTFWMMSWWRVSPTEAASIVRGLFYIGLATAAAVTIALLHPIHPSTIFTVRLEHIPLGILGALGEISLALLLVRVYLILVGNGVDVAAEVADIPWLRSTLATPRALVFLAVIISAAAEEIVFRGMLLRLSIDLIKISPGAVVVLGAASFLCQQLTQVRTRHQAAAVGSACVVISILGSFLVFQSHSVVPAVAAHASFVVFHVRRIVR